MSNNSFNTASSLEVGGRTLYYHSLASLPQASSLPLSIRVLLENLLRHEDGKTVTKEQITRLLRWDAAAEPSQEIAYRPARVLMQDFTGVPGVVDLASMRDVMRAMGKDPARIEPLMHTDLVIDHSVQVDVAGNPQALAENTGMEFARNGERYAFLKWGQQTFNRLRVAPPGAGIVHQVNIEHLAGVVWQCEQEGRVSIYPDTLVGTDSHTTMVNGLGVLGWGVGGIEAEAAMLGQPISMLVPQVVGFCLSGNLPAGATATDLVLTVTAMLRRHGVVGKFVEFYGPGVAGLSLADRATIANMAPEYGATCGLFPVDEQTLEYLELTGRSPEQLAAVEAYYRAQGMFGSDQKADYSERLELDMGEVVPCLAGPKRPQDNLPLGQVGATFRSALREAESRDEPANADLQIANGSHQLKDGAVVIAAITSCTNTSNPSVMLGAGLLAKNANARGLRIKPWVKASLAPGSRVVTRYLSDSGLLAELEQQRFHVVGYGCTTCIGNSGPLPAEVSRTIQQGGLNVASVLSGNRNFEGRVNPEVKMNFLASPPLVVAYAIAGTVDIDLTKDPLATDAEGRQVYLSDIWPDNEQIRSELNRLNRAQFVESYSNVLEGDDAWRAISAGAGSTYEWDPSSTYVRNPPFFADMDKPRETVDVIEGARMLAYLGDSVTTDHISPAGSIKADSPAGKYLMEQGINPKDFNSYGSRRGNHEVMMRGTFANIRLRNKVAPGTEGGVTRHMPSGEEMSIYDAAMRYKDECVPAIVIAGKEYGTGSSRDWAAKGPLLLGIKAVIAESFERIHRTNLVGMGILPLQFNEGESAESLGLTGNETITISGIANGASKEVEVTANGDDARITFAARVRIDTPQEIEYYQQGGILRYVLRELSR